MDGDGIDLDDLDELLQEPLLDDADASQHETFLRWVLLNADEISYGDQPVPAAAAPSEGEATDTLAAGVAPLGTASSLASGSASMSTSTPASSAARDSTTGSTGDAPPSAVSTGEAGTPRDGPMQPRPRSAPLSLPPPTAVAAGLSPFLAAGTHVHNINPLGFVPNASMAMGLAGLPPGANAGAYLLGLHQQQQVFKMGLAASHAPGHVGDATSRATSPTPQRSESQDFSSAGSKKRDRSEMEARSPPEIQTPPLDEKMSALEASNAQLRKKKKPKMEELQERLQVLRSENSELSHHLTNVEQRHKLLNQEKKAMENLIRKQLEATQSGAGDSSELARVIQDFKNRYADYGPQRQRECNFHMDQLERLLIPTQTTKMSLWTMEQPASFFDDPNKNSLGAILKRELGVTGEQRERISNLRARVKEAVRDLRAAMSYLRDLRQHINHKHSSFDVRMRELQDILTPTQAAKLILWVKTNRHKVRNGLNLTARDMFGAGAEYTDEHKSAGTVGDVAEPALVAKPEDTGGGE